MSRILALFIGFSLLATGCGDSAATTTTTTEVREPVSLRLTFDGENCTYEGPTELTAGPVELDYFNESTELATGEFARIKGDQTFEDAIEYGQQDPIPLVAPTWAEITYEKTAMPGGNTHWEGDLEKGQRYFMVCRRVVPLAVWFGAGLTVGP
jgi:hypothetical protein